MAHQKLQFNILMCVILMMFLDILHMNVHVLGGEISWRHSSQGHYNCYNSIWQ